MVKERDFKSFFTHKNRKKKANGVWSNSKHDLKNIYILNFFFITYQILWTITYATETSQARCLLVIKMIKKHWNKDLVQ